MRHLLDTLHILVAVFAIGPLVHAATTASRGVRRGDAAAVAGSARTVRIYAAASVLVVIFGMSLVQSKYHHEFADTWVWLSILLWVVATGLAFGLLLPGLRGAATAITSDAPVSSFTARVAAAGGTIALIYAVIVVLMVYKPGR